MALGDVWRLSLVGLWSGVDQGVVTLHFKDISGTAEFASLASSIKTGLLTSLKSQQPAVWSWTHIAGLTENTIPKVTDEYSTGFPLVGTNVATEPLPQMDAAIVSWRTGYAGRSYRGRSYLPAFCEGAQTQGYLVAGTVTALTGYLDTFLALYGVGGTDTNWQLGIWSDKLAVFTPVTSYLLRSTMGTQRRRRPGVGS